jgi:hypothetical protein
VARIVSWRIDSFWRTPIRVCSTEITAMFASRHVVRKVALGGDLLVDEAAGGRGRRGS